MKISIYVQIQDHDGYVFVRGVTTDDPFTGQKTISSPLGTPSKTYRIMADFPDVNKVHRIDVKQENIEEVKE